MSEQMRAEFSKHCQLWRYSEEVDENDFFANVTTQRAWDVWVTAWKASRQVLVVELPVQWVPPYEEREVMAAICVLESLENAGVSYK
jgi:hypothetical protein